MIAMKTFLSGVLGVAVALAAIAGWVSRGDAGSRPVTSASSQPSAAVSFESTGARVADSRLDLVRASFEKLTDYGQSPAAVVDAASVRQVGRNAFLAVRTDGSVCLSQRATLGCYTGFEPGGIATTVGDGRMFDSPSAPFEVVIDGIARDGVASVTYRLSDGSERTADVSKNAFALTIPNHLANDLTGYTVRTATGRVTRTFARDHFPKPDLPLRLLKR